MKILLNDLSALMIQKLVINSLEQALYQAIVVIDGKEYVVWETDEKVLTTRSLMQMREYFELMTISEVILRHESPYDEMIGLPGNQSNNRLEVPLAKSPYPVS